MAGSKESAARAKQSEIEGYMERLGMTRSEAYRHYRERRGKMGKVGGSRVNTKTPKGFAANRELARIAGQHGRATSKRKRYAK